MDLPKTWETLRYAYIRVYPTGKREQARYAYLTKAEIQKRRSKAQDDSIWREWPLEMVYKTMCHYAGNRELFPTDDPARYVMVQSEQAEIGSGASNAETWGSLPAGSKTAGLAARLAAKSSGTVIDVGEGRPLDGEGRPLDAVDVQPQDVGGETFTPAATQEGEQLTDVQVTEIRDLINRTGVSLDDIEGHYGAKLAEIVVTGLDAKALEDEIVREVRERAAALRAEKEGGQLPLGGKKR